MSDLGEFRETAEPPAPRRPPRRLGPWTIGTWLSWAWVIGLIVFIFHDGVPVWLLALVGSVVALIVMGVLGGLAWRAIGREAQQPVRMLAAAIAEASDAGGTPLGRSVRRWTVGLYAAGLVFGLLSYGGLDFVPPGWPRLGVLTLTPIALWLGLVWCWKRWRPDREAEVRFGRGIAGVAAGALLVGGVLTSQRTSHYACTERVYSIDGSDCVGDEVEVPGPDLFEVLLLTGLGATAFWVSVSAKPWAAR